MPERDSRILIDGKKIDGDTNLTQGAMLTIGKSNYLRFNNPAEAQLLKSTIGSNERISMPQIDFNQDSSSSSNEGTPDDMLKNLQDILQYQNFNNRSVNQQMGKKFNQQAINNETILEKMTKNDFTNLNNFHSPKVFAADSITVNTPAKDVLGTKFNNFTKNLTQIFSKNDKNNQQQQQQRTHSNQPTFTSNSNESNVTVLTKVNNLSSNSSSPKVQPFSACYDRYPKPGSYGSLQVFPMNGINNEINSNHQNQDITEMQRNRAQIERMQEEEISKLEHERMEEIIKMCADFERQNQANVQSSPIVQNRIKTNGSLPRDKKPPYSDDNPFFPSNGYTTSTEYNQPKPTTGYENVKIQCRRVELSGSPPPPPGRYENVHPGGRTESSPTSNGSGYENVFIPKKSGYVPQSPRTKIKTCVSPKKENYFPVAPITPKKQEYDMLVQSFEEKLRMEIQLLRENKNLEKSPDKEWGATGSTKGPEPIYGTLEKRNKNINNLTLNIKRSDVSGKKELIERYKEERKNVLAIVRELKTEISELQRQEEEVLREV